MFTGLHMTVLDVTEALLNSHWWTVPWAPKNFRAWHICSQGSLYQHPNQETSPAPYKAALLPFTSLDASPCIFDITPVLQARWQRQYLLPTMTQPLVAQPLSFEPWTPWTMFLHTFTSTPWQFWTTEAHILHMFHLNIPGSLEGHVFQNLGE